MDFDERKGNATPYFTFISRDGIHEIKKWLEVREGIIQERLSQGEAVDKEIIDGEAIFITSRATPLQENTFAHQVGEQTAGKATSHMFRILFESEAKVPDRAIDREYIKFFMGHAAGQDDAGGTYDRNPEIRPDVAEKEYAKLEPYINIYTSTAAQRRQDPLLRDIEELARLPPVREALASIVGEVKHVLATKLQREKIE